MSKYMEEFFGPYTEEDLTAGYNALAGGSVATGMPITIVDQKGATFTDTEGREYIDCTSQAWSLGIGACHPKVIAAVAEQIKHATHVRTGFGTIPKFLLCKRLTDIAPGNLKKVNFCLHGSVANEGAIKLAIRNRPGRRYFLTPWLGYAGRTLATMALSWPHPNNKFLNYMENAIRFPHAYCYRCYFERTYPECGLECAKFLRQMIEHAIDGEPAALIMEPVQGSGGMIDYPREYYHEIRKSCDDYGMLLIWDEIQTAFGRVGAMFAADLYGVVPDILTFGKSIGGGFPLAGTLVRDDLDGFGPGDHSFTFSHFPVAMAAGVVTLQVLQEEQLPQRAAKVGAYITQRLREMQNKYELLGDVRGPGLMLGVELVRNRKTKEPAVEETHRFVTEALKRGVLLGESRYMGLGNVVKIKPPFMISEAQVERVLEVFEEVTAMLSP
ncbi:MAG: aspartate aminotransferase family protein [Chloroflexi bacterium]|nr:aspartate aminotransferase family protein [Chloroflexota bacterium]